VVEWLPHNWWSPVRFPSKWSLKFSSKTRSENNNFPGIELVKQKKVITIDSETVEAIYAQLSDGSGFSKHVVGT